MKQAEEIGKGGSHYIRENLKMKFVYDYMFHVLQEYAKLLKFKPAIPKGAVEICPETVACPMNGLGSMYEKYIRISFYPKWFIP